MRHVVLALPTYDGTRLNSLAIVRLIKHPPQDTTVSLIEMGGSVLCYGFNSLWANALNLRDHPTYPATHFLMMHADIVPITDRWLDIMLGEMDKVQADVLSAVVPIKNEQGMTSTARDTDPWNPLRFTMTEIATRPSQTWTQPDLLVNTGLLLVDLRKDWVEKVLFTMRDAILKDDDGTYRAVFAPEDWEFSRQARALGARIYATTMVELNHVGRAQYHSRSVWGYPTDELYRASKEAGKKD